MDWDEHEDDAWENGVDRLIEERWCPVCLKSEDWCMCDDDDYWDDGDAKCN